MSGNPGDEIRIPLSVDTNIDPLLQKLRQADVEMERLEQRATRLFNTLKVQGPGGPLQATSYAEVEQYTRMLGGPAALGSPAFTQAMQRREQRQGQLVQAAQQGQDTPPPTARQQERDEQRRQRQDQQQQRQQDRQDQQRQRTQDRQQRQQESAEEQRRRKRQQQEQERQEYEALLRRGSFLNNLGPSVLRSTSVVQYGMFATGNAGPLARSVAGAVLDALGDTITARRTVSQIAAMRAAATGADGAAGAAAGAATGAEGAAAAGAGASGGGDLAAGLSGLLMNPVTGALLLGVAGSLAANLLATETNVEKQGLAVATGTTGLGFTSETGKLYERLNAMSGPDSFGYGTQTFTAAEALGRAGVRLPQIAGATAASLAFAREASIDPTQSAQLVGTLMARGGQSVQDVTRTLQRLEQQARKTGVPLARMTDQFTALAQATGGANISVNGLAAVQSVIGPGINAGQLVAPAMGALGANALAMSAMLGVSPQQFAQVQGTSGRAGNPAALMDLVGGFARRTFGGQNSETNRMVLEQLLQGSGLLDLSNVSPGNADKLTSSLLTGNRNQFERVAGQIAKGEKVASGQTWEAQMIGLAQRETSFLSQLMEKLEQLGRSIGNLAGDIHSLSGPISNLTNLPGDLVSLSTTLNRLPGDFTADLVAALANALGIKMKPQDIGKIPVLGGALTMAGNALGLDPVTFTKDWANLWMPGRTSHAVQMTYQGIQQARQEALLGGMATPKTVFVPDTRGGVIAVPTKMLAQYQAASAQTGVPLSVLLAQGARESDYRNVRQKGGAGLGVAQWDFSTRANQLNAEHWLGASSVQQAERYAMDPARAIAAQARYDESLYATEGRSWQKALAAYNGSGPQAQEYGVETFTASQATQLELDAILHLDVRDAQGHALGKTEAKTRVPTTIDHTRRLPGHKPQGPDPTAKHGGHHSGSGQKPPPGGWD